MEKIEGIKSNQKAGVTK